MYRYLILVLLFFLGCSRDNDHPHFSVGSALVSEFSKFHLNNMNGTMESKDSSKTQLNTSGVFYAFSPTMEFIGKMGPYDVKIRMVEDAKRYNLSGKFGPIGSLTGDAYLSNDNSIYLDFRTSDKDHYQGKLLKN